MSTLTGTGDLNDLAGKVVGYQHPIYATWAPVWIKLAHVREGAGGFLTGEYLIAHPREWKDHSAARPKVPTKKLTARRALASYENFGGTIIDAKKSALFRETPIRRIGDGKQQETAPIEDWWDDVDGNGTDIDTFMQMAWDIAATFGHVYIYMELDGGVDNPQTAADQGQPYLCLYTPLDALDWLEDQQGKLTAVKFVEGVQRETFNDTNLPLPQVRTVDEKKWSLYQRQTGNHVETQTHPFGTLPVVCLYSQRRPLIPRIGQAVIGDPQLFIDLYNLLSELRELLRNQTFSLLNIPLGTGPDALSVEKAKEMLGTQTGTENVVFSGSAASFISAQAENVVAYQEEIQRRLRMIYRLAALHWDSDKRGVEATGSVELKREDMNQRLSAYADEIEKAELAIADLWYRATYGADVGPGKLEKDGVTVQYPDTFEVTPFDVVLKQAQSALSVGMPTEVMKELRKDLLSKFLPEISPETKATLEDAIDNAAPDLTPAEQMQMKLDATVGAAGGKKEPTSKGGKPAPAKGDKAA